MTLMRYMKTRYKYKFLLLSFVVALIALTVILVQIGHKPGEPNISTSSVQRKEYPKPHTEIVVEKFNEHDYKVRVIKEKIQYLTESRNEVFEVQVRSTIVSEVTQHVHIFYTTYINWTIPPQGVRPKSKRGWRRYMRGPNTRYYPLLGEYLLSYSILDSHFEKIKQCGIGVIIVAKTLRLTEDLFEDILNIAEKHELSVATEFILQQNQSTAAVVDYLNWLKKYEESKGLYKVFSISRNESIPLVYIQNAYRLEPYDKFFCTKSKSLETRAAKAVLIGHIKTKGDAELMRRICFNGFYPSIPSNGATFASTWKNWSYLRAFAQSYKMFFIPTVGPGYEPVESIYTSAQKNRNAGRYYEVAWRTALSTYIGFVTISSFNNWEEGSQIEEAISKPGEGFYKTYTGEPNIYLDLTKFWINEFLKTAKANQENCYKFVNNSIC